MMAKRNSSDDGLPDELLIKLQQAAEEQKRIADRQEVILVRLQQELNKITK